MLKQYIYIFAKVYTLVLVTDMYPNSSAGFSDMPSMHNATDHMSPQAENNKGGTVDNYKLFAFSC